MSDQSLALLAFLTMWGTAMAVVLSVNALLTTMVLFQYLIHQ